MSKIQKIIISLVSILVGALLIAFAMMSQGDKTVVNEKYININQLNKADGKNGNDCYVAISGTVYEITQGDRWINGEHQPSEGLAYCGQDLTEVIGQSPHGKSILSLTKEIGKLE